MSLRFVALFLTCGFAAAGCATHVHQGEPPTPPPEPVKTDFIRQKNVTFTPDDWPVPLQADVYLPTSELRPRPAVLLIYGGGWTDKDNRYQMAGIARKLARRGYVVLSASYRGAPKWHYPAPVDDLQQALRWLRAHQSEYAIDPQRVAAFGYSAGGHLAELIGLTDGPAETRVQAVVAGGAPSDLMLFSDDSRLVNQFMGERRGKIPEAYRAASPIHAASAKNPPLFLYHATGDRLVPPEHTRIMDLALTAAGVRHEVYWIKGRGHITGFIWDAGAEEAAITFLDRVLRAP